MTFPPPHPSSQNSIASGTNKAPGARLARSQQQPAWGSSAHPPTARRGLAPLSTNVAQPPSIASPSRRLNPSDNTSATSPFASTFSSVLTSSSRLVNSRNNSSSSSSASPFPTLQTGSQQLPPSQLLSSPRSRTITQSSVSHLASSAAASTTASQGGGGGSGGGGGASRNATFSPSLSQPSVNSPTNAAFDRTAASSSSLNISNNNSASVAKIVIAQLFLLLGSITEKEGKAKWESQADQIRKLIDSNGMEVFSKYFRRLLVGNAPAIFAGSNRNVENAATYQLLVQEMQKVSRDPDQAYKIAEVVDTSDGDMFRDFDLSTFMDHFKLDPLAKTILALAFKTVSKPDLKTKGLTSVADAILSNNFQYFLQSLANPSLNALTDHDLSSSFLATLVERFAQYPPRNLGEEGKARVGYAIRLRYQKQGVPLPPEVNAALQLVELLGPDHALVHLIQQTGPRCTSSGETARELLSSFGNRVDEDQIADALLYMAFSPDWPQYSPAVFVATVRDHVGLKGLKWSRVIGGFDREGLRVSKEQFMVLYSALLPIALDGSSVDIQNLWGGRWKHADTQLSFLTAFLTLSPNQLDASTIPQLRQGFTSADFSDAKQAVAEYAEQAQKSTIVSSDAMMALFDILLQSRESTMTPEGQAVFKEVVEANMDVFLCSAFGATKPWNELQEGIFTELIYPFIFKQRENYEFVLHGLWKQDKNWVASRLMDAHLSDPMQLPLLLDHAREQHWLEDLVMLLNGFGIDLAAYAHRRGLLDLDQWAQRSMQRGPQDFARSLCKFLTIKAEDEQRSARKQQSAPRTVSLATKTVWTLLEILEDNLADRRDELTMVQRLCLSSYPRIINYGEGFDDIIDANGEESNILPDHADVKMQDYYKQMYSGAMEVRELIEVMRQFKTSREPADQDIFACMIQGLFEEYTCYHGYPLEALATTAVLFGAIINYDLLSGISLRVSLGMILEAVRDNGPESKMYKFGLQALLNFIDRLQEWPGFCSRLVQIPDLRGTEVYKKAEDVMHEQASQSNPEVDTNGINGFSDGLGLTNGNIDDFLAPDNTMQRFRSLHVDPPFQADVYEEPNEEVQDKVLFVLNNVSDRNIEVKLKDLKDTLEDKHFQWFASYLVEERAKLQPNYQQLYFDLLDLFGDKTLWAEVLRETYVSVIRMLNAEATMNSTIERTHLKNLAGWLGSLTIARNKPIKHKNISFKDLLIEAYDTQRLLVVIPFTCKVLLQAARSTVFKPPNPWLMDILRLLIELYYFAELKLNLKFEIEVLCKDLHLDHKSIEPSTGIRDRPHLDDDISGPTLPDGLDAFDDLSLGVLNRGVRSERFSPAAIASTLPDLEPLLSYPPPSNGLISPERLKQIVRTAVQRAILEIISPVVERSVTIAAIATAQLIHKDFAMEADENKVRQSAQTMVRSLAGSLALVTCKEPLRMSMTNYIRMMQQDLPDQALPEGAVLMCVNDNLEIACGMVEKAAEQRSLPEIDVNVEDQLAARRRHRANRPNEAYIDPMINRWAFFIPEPYRQTPGGLNKEQMAIYEEFTRQSRGPVNHLQTGSADSGRQLPDVLQETFPSVPSFPTPAETPALPHQAPQQHKQQPRLLPPSVPVSGPQHQVNGFMDVSTLQDRILDLLSELQRVAKEAPEQHVSDLPRESATMDVLNQLLYLLVSAPPYIEQIALAIAQRICVTLYSQTEQALEIEVLVQLLSKLCQISSSTAKEVILWMANTDDERALNVPVTVALLNSGLMELQRVDSILAKAIQQRKVVAVEFLSNLMSEVLLNERPIGLRADFASSLEAMGLWLAEDPTLTAAQELVRKLKESGVPAYIEGEPDERSRFKRQQMEYIFSEWVALCTHSSSTDRTLSAFISQLHQKQIMNTQEESALFFRLCIDASIEMFEREDMDPAGNSSDAYIWIDALAKLIVLLVKYQGEANGAVKGSKPAYLNSILALIVLVLNHHHVMRGERFNQRVFFRLFSSVLCEYHAVGRQGPEQDQEIMLVFANIFLVLQPLHIPGFVYGWLTLISHRVFMPDLLKMPDEIGWEPYAKLMEAMLSYICELLKPLNVAGVTKDLYRGVLRILLILHHDFPEFLAENHFRLCNVIPSHCTQLRNLILSAYPSSFTELPDPFTAGLKVDRLEEVRKAPNIIGDIISPLRRANIKDIVDRALRSNDISEDSITKIAEAIYHPPRTETSMLFTPVNVDTVLLNALVLYICHTAISTAGQKGGPTFTNNSPQASLMEKLAKELRPEGRYYFLSAIANQLRYPNSHTHYFSYALLHLFGTDHADQQESDVRQQITRVLLERLIVHRPHPWGLIITLLELLKNSNYMFWDLPFIKAAPEIERLFSALFHHINQSPRSLV